MSTTTALARTPTQASSPTNTNAFSSVVARSPTSPSASSSNTTSLFKPSLTSQKAIATPQSSTSTPTQQPSPAISEPGSTWKHPRLGEVIRRQNKTRFDRDNVRAISKNLVALLGALITPSAMNKYVLTLPRLSALTNSPLYWPWYATYTTIWLLRLLFLLNITLSLLPLFRTPDTCEDIPLDPIQRQLMGLPPLSRPATPQEKEQYVTPPRYSRSNTPRSTSSSLVGNASDSPLTGKGATPMDNSIHLSGSFYNNSSLQLSPGGGSGDHARRRLSYNHSNRSSPLSLSEFESAGNASGMLGTPTKGGSGAGRASIGLNSKWLYEKGRRGSGSSRLSGNFA